MAIGDEVVYPATIERALYGTAGVADMAAVDVDGSIVAAIVAEADAPPDAAALLARLRRALAAHEAPSRIVQVDSIPRNAAGKVRRDELRDLVDRSVGVSR